MTCKIFSETINFSENHLAANIVVVLISLALFRVT